MNACLILLVFAALGNDPTGTTVERWGLLEVALPGPTSGNPYLDVQWSTTFSLGEQHIKVPGFYDDQGIYKVRFSPPTQGTWTYVTHSTQPELNNQSGSFTVGPPAENNHGPVQVFQTYYLQYADGSPYHQFGTTCYAWVHQLQELQEQTLRTLAAAPFNKIRFCVFPKSYYVANNNEPERFAFQKGADGKFDFNRPDPQFWRRFEERIVDLQKLGIEADIILWHPYDRWGFADMSDAEDDRYLRYCIARLSAFRNVWWSLANEYDFMTNRPSGHRGNKQWADWDRFFAILSQEDPHQRLRGIHNGSQWYDHTKDWVTHASLQTSDMKGGVRFRAQYRKPVVYDECRYEGDLRDTWGNLTAREMVQRFWLGTLSGCYVGHGETYKHPEDILWWSKGGVLHGQSPLRIQWLKDFLAQAPAFHELEPLGDDKGRFLLAKPGTYYLLYCLDGRSQSLTLAGDKPYKVDLVDPWEMTITPVGTAQAGDYSVSAPKADVAFRFTPYQPGEKLRPEAKITASITEGVVPLAVQFNATGNGTIQWDFGDGAISDDPHPRHVFEKPGMYSVTLAVTDSDGNSGRSTVQIAVDRHTDDPLVRAGWSEGESPALTLHGTARRTESGSLHFPDGEPWGWVQAGDEGLDELRGLRSFTIAGWLKPDSLQVGSGGNRIVFCLNSDHSGIDLVCHADGRLRLAVNQWPDSVDNDSSPGRLAIGKWTFFAVTYDATQMSDSVSWYFTDPLDAPVQADVILDRKTSYNVGPVGSDIGRLVIGNFNDTMQSYGLDRQFRGEVRELRLLGSRVSGRGALTREAVQALIH
jgi:PKD repeat protein